MKRCGSFSPLGAEAPNPNAWSSRDVSVRLLQNEAALPDVAAEIAQLRRAGVFDGLSAVLESMAVPQGPRDVDEAEVMTVSDPEDGTEMTESTGSPELLAMIRQMMNKKQKIPPQYAPSDEEDDEDEDDDEEDEGEEDNDEEDEEEEDDDDEEEDDDDEEEDEDDDDEEEDEDDEERTEDPRGDSVSFFPSDSEDDYVVEIPEVPETRAVDSTLPPGIPALVQTLVRRQELTDVADIDSALLSQSLTRRVPTIAKVQSSRMF